MALNIGGGTMGSFMAMAPATQIVIAPNRRLAFCHKTRPDGRCADLRWYQSDRIKEMPKPLRRKVKNWLATGKAVDVAELAARFDPVGAAIASGNRTTPQQTYESGGNFMPNFGFQSGGSVFDTSFGGGTDWTNVLGAGISLLGNIFGDDTPQNTQPIPVPAPGLPSPFDSSGWDMPGGDLVGQGLGSITNMAQPYRANRYGMVSRKPFVTVNPRTGEADWWAPAKAVVKVTSRRYNAAPRRSCRKR